MRGCLICTDREYADHKKTSKSIYNVADKKMMRHIATLGLYIKETLIKASAKIAQSDFVANWTKKPQ